MSGARASATIAAGTIASRVTGLVRSVVLVVAFGSLATDAGNAFAIANQLPNNIFALVSSGLFAGILVPQIIKAARHRDGGSAFVSKLITLGVVVVGAVTLLAIIVAPLLVLVYGGRMPPEAIALTLAFSYWCLPQLFFLGLYALIGEILNARRVFGPYAWSPVVNNVVSIAGFLAFVAVFGPTTTADGWTPGMLALVGGTATAGIALQTIVLVLFWKRAELTVRADFRWRGMGLRHMGRLAGWTFLMVVAGQIAGAVQVNLVGSASQEGAAAAALQFAWTIFILPYSVIVLSIVTPYYTRLSEHADAGDVAAVRGDLVASGRTISMFIVGALAAMGLAILPLSRVFTHDAAQAPEFALVLGGYLVALIPLAIQAPLTRTFYAYHDTFRPFVFTLVQCVLVVVTAVLAYLWLPVGLLAFGIALGQSLANIVQVALAAFLLRRRVGPTGVAPTLASYVRFALLALPAIAAGALVAAVLGAFDVSGGWALQSLFTAIVAVAVIGFVVCAAYAATLVAARVPEVAPFAATVRRRLTR